MSFQNSLQDHIASRPWMRLQTRLRLRFAFQTQASGIGRAPSAGGVCRSTMEAPLALGDQSTAAGSALARYIVAGLVGEQGFWRNWQPPERHMTRLPGWEQIRCRLGLAGIPAGMMADGADLQTSKDIRDSGSRAMGTVSPVNLLRDTVSTRPARKAIRSRMESPLNSA